MLMESYNLAYPQIDLPYKLYTDTSQYAVGDILAQQQEGSEREW